MFIKNTIEADEAIKNATHERDILDSIWNRYLSKYRSQYKIEIEKETNTQHIVCKYGKIEPFGLKRGLLLFYGGFPSQTKKTYFLKKIPSMSKPTQEGYDEVVIPFPEKDLELVEELFQIRKRRIISEEKKEIMRRQLSERLLKAKTNKKNNNV